MRIFLLAVCCCFNFYASAQAPRYYASSDILAALKKLNVLGSVLYIAAHPDDENTRLLAYLSQEKLYRTGYLSVTRGDGGQNLIGSEQGVSLGLIRTQELLAARRIDGAAQFFTSGYDFGFSKTPEETFKIWDKEKILSEMVLIIRRFQPDVIIARFPEDGRGGHGHHTASAILAHEAFLAAADPKRFPEQLKLEGIDEVWQAKRLLWNTFNFGSANTTSDSQFKTNVGGYNAILGKSYGEIAAESRSQHKSQGFGVARSRGESFEYFTTVEGQPPTGDLMSGVDLSWKRASTDTIEERVNAIIRNFDAADPSKSVAALGRLKIYLQTINNSVWTLRKIEELNTIIAACMGFYAEAVTTAPFAVEGDSLSVALNFINRSAVPVKKLMVKYQDSAWVVAEGLPSDKYSSVRINRPVKRLAMQDQPYWLKEKMEQGSFNVKDPSLIGMPQNIPESMTLIAELENSVQLDLSIPLQYKYTDPVKGEIYQPLVTVPALLIRISPSVLLANVVPSVKQTVKVEYQKQSDKPYPGVKILFNNGVKRPLNLSGDLGTLQTLSFSADSVLKKGQQELSASVVVEKDEPLSFSNYMRMIHHEHIPPVHYLFQSQAKIINEEIRTQGKRVGYIPGAGDDVPDALKGMGYELVVLEEDDITESNLKNLDAIVTGVRAYNIHTYLSGKYELLMNYIRNGGNLIVQYNTSSSIGPVKAKIGPYPFTISRTRVTDEKARVNFLKPAHPLLNVPNKISDSDFEGWIQERSIYHAQGWDKNYETVFSMHDPGEQEDEGSLITTRYGKGNFIYTGLVFFRELPAGVPGAYRLLANMIAL